MKIKPSKCQSLSLLKGNCKEIKFSVSGNEIPTIHEKSIKSLSRCYSLPLTDQHRWQDLRKQQQNGLHSIDKCDLMNKDKIWCIYFGLIPKLTWPLQIYEISVVVMPQTILPRRNRRCALSATSTWKPEEKKDARGVTCFMEEIKISLREVARFDEYKRD